jgi:hypothetical protein
MTSEDGRGNTAPDWVIPAILVGIAALVILAVTIGVVLARGDSEPETLPEQLEAYTECLRSNGATVPLVEARRDGGVAIVFEGSLLEEGFELSSILDAAGSCEDEMPSAFRIPGELLGGFDLGALGGLSGSGLFGGDFFGEDLEGMFPGDAFSDGFGRGPHRPGGPDGLRFGPGFEEGLPLEDLCEALEDDVPPDLPGIESLREACDLTGA